MNFSNPNLESLIGRVEKLESQNRRWKLAAVILALASGSLLTVGARFADRIDSPVLRARTVEAQEFLLKDEDGRVYARLTMNPNKIDMNGRTIVVGPATTGPALQFYGDNGQPIWTAPQKPMMVPTIR